MAVKTRPYGGELSTVDKCGGVLKSLKRLRVCLLCFYFKNIGGAEAGFEPTINEYMPLQPLFSCVILLDL